MCNNFRTSIMSSKFSQCPKLAEITPLYKKEKEALKESYNQVVFCQTCHKFMKKLPLHKWLNFSELHFLSIGVDFTKGSVYNDAF